jgi:hypothetical protein
MLPWIGLGCHVVSIDTRGISTRFSPRLHRIAGRRKSAHERPVLLEPNVSSDGSESDVCSNLLRREENFMRSNGKAQ